VVCHDKLGEITQNVSDVPALCPIDSARIPPNRLELRPLRLGWHISCLVDAEVKNVVDYEQICIEGVGQVSKGFRDGVGVGKRLGGSGGCSQ
jgi:hypothetical protein